MTEQLRFSVRVNNDLDLGQLLDVARVAEDAGFDQLWCSNDLFLHSALAMLPVLTSQTSTISVGTGVVNPYTLHTSEIAMFHRTLAEMSSGRVLLGLAAGAKDFLSWVGLRQDRPLGKVRASIHELKYLLAGTGGRPPAWAGGPHLLGDHDVPLYLGAMGPKMLALAGELADGVLPLLFPPERFVEARQAVIAGARNSDRDPDDIDMAACVWVSVSSDREEAKATLAEKIAYYGPSFSDNVLDGIGLTRSELEPARQAHLQGDLEKARKLVPDDALRLGIYGTSQDVIERSAQLIDKGARHISFGPPLGPEPISALRLIGKEVVPALTRS